MPLNFVTTRFSSSNRNEVKLPEGSWRYSSALVDPYSLSMRNLMPWSAPSHEAPDQKGNRPPVPNVNVDAEDAGGAIADHTPVVIGPAIAVDGASKTNPN